jgi:hypothetical protein
MESSESVSYLALSDFCPERCGSTVVRRASFGDIEVLAGELPMLPQRSYRIGSNQGIVVLATAVIDRRYRWVVALERSIAVEVDEVLLIALGSGVLLRAIEVPRGLGFDRLRWKRSHCRACFCIANDGVLGGCQGVIALFGCQ